jgi:Flp pilus assembly protein TadG
MPQLTRVRKLWRQLATPGFADRGGVAVIVSVLLAGGVLLGMAALSVDVGQLYAEREELMSAADASALSIAGECGKQPLSCATSTSLADVQARAQTIANANGKDGRNDVTLVCGRGGALAPCDPTKEPTNLTACLNIPPASANYVEVHTATATQTSTVLPTAFAGSFVPGYEGGTVGACSRVAWGPPAGGLSLTFALCEWNNDTNYGHDLVTFPPNPPASAEHVVYVHGSNASTCTNTPPSGWDAPGGFGWLDPDNANSCYTSILSDDSYPGNTGSNVDADCLTAIANAQANRTPVLIPVYDGTIDGTGSNETYHAAGVVAFVITGYYFNGSPVADVPSWLTGRRLCSGNDRCIYGFFVSALLPADTLIDPNAPDLGATVIKTVG